MRSLSFAVLSLVVLLAAQRASAQYGAAGFGAQQVAAVVVTDPAAQSHELLTQVESATKALEDAQLRAARAEVEVEALDARRNEADTRLYERVRALYRMRKASAWPLGAGIHAVLAHVSRLEHLERIVKRDLAAQAFLTRRGEAISETLRAARADLSVAELRSRDLERHRQLLDQQLRVYGYGGIAAFVPALAQPSRALSPDAASPAVAALPSLGVAPLPTLGTSPTPTFGPMPSLSQAAAPAPTYGGLATNGGALAPTLAVAPSVPTLHFPVGGGVDAAMGPPSASGFAVLRGRLSSPIASASAVRGATRDDGEGLEFAASPGTEVRAAADGRVAFAGRYGAYGTLVIVDHGESFYTVYGGLGAVTASVGEQVPRGGKLGDVAGGARSALFFEVRRGARTLDARSWLP